MFPEAWNIEHNRLHHYHLGEDKDPDLVQRNLEFLRQMDFLPLPAKYALVSGMAGIWKWFYYAPNTYKELKLSEFVRDGKEFPEGLKPTDATTVRAMLFPVDDAERSMNELVDVDDFFTKVLGPMFFSRFVMLPAPLLLVPGVGPSLFGHALINLMLADLATNFHGFLTIVTNHAGEDVYAFDDEVKPKSGAFYVRQIVGSVNYVPYIQESVWERLRKTVDVMVGSTSMPDFPTHLEPAKDKAGVSGVTWKSTNGAIDEDEDAASA
jgi:hypothetical protein